MEVIPEIKACINCAKTKRKCGKEQPRCHRCQTRDWDCVYPPARPSAFVRLQDGPQSFNNCYSSTTPAASTSTLELPNTGTNAPDDWDPGLFFFPTHNLSLLALPPSPSCTPNISLTSKPLHLTTDWFLAPSTWHSSHPDHPPTSTSSSPPEVAPAPYNNKVLKRYLTHFQRNLATWPSTGSTAFLHRHLYTHRTPSCIHDAQSALALYLARTEANDDAVFCTLEDRVRSLLARGEEDSDGGITKTPFEMLARAQALLTYQIIGLLDGDIRLRAVAEARIKVLRGWVELMVKTMREICKEGMDLELAVRELGLGIGQSLLGVEVNDLVLREEMVWHAWIFAESLRRTWITAKGLETTYHALKEGWAECPGGMRMTVAEGLWDADSSFAWAKAATGKLDMLFMDGKDTERLFVEARPSDVDWFTKACMEVSFGMERMERWGADPVAAC